MLRPGSAGSNTAADHLAVLDAAITALLALDGAMARAEPKALRYRLLHAAARLTRGGRQRLLKIQASWPRAADIVTSVDRIVALPQAP